MNSKIKFSSHVVLYALIIVVLITIFVFGTGCTNNLTLKPAPIIKHTKGVKGVVIAPAIVCYDKGSMISAFELIKNPALINGVKLTSTYLETGLCGMYLPSMPPIEYTVTGRDGELVNVDLRNTLTNTTLNNVWVYELFLSKPRK